MTRYLLPLLLCIAISAVSAVDVRADDGLDLRNKITEFTQAAKKRRWQLEDRLAERERHFEDGLTQEYREVVLKGLESVKSASDWKQAQRSYREQIRAEVALLRQKIRVHRDEFDLTFLATYAEQEKELKAFLAPIEEEFRKNKSDAYRKAESDFTSSRDELREDLKSWKERVKNLKVPSDYFSY